MRVGLALAALAGLVAGAVPLGERRALAAGRDTLSFPDGTTATTVGANVVVRVDGAITFTTTCGEGGIKDFVFPATDVYVVAAGTASAGATLVDAGGGRPNTIVADATVFVDETIAVTAPAGSLDDGAYDVVYDTCQDGKYDPGTDTLFPGAITVVMPDVLPLASSAITAMKHDALVDYASWMATRMMMQQLFKLADRAMKASCSVGNAVACAMKKVGYYDPIKDRVLALMLSQANHYLAIHADPPDTAFRQLTTVAAPAEAAAVGASGVAAATSGTIDPMVAEAALSEALLHAVERYQGAVAAGDGDWALVHARAAANLASVLAQAEHATAAALVALRDEAASDATFGSVLDTGSAFAHRVWQSGFAPDERRALANLGLDAVGIAGLEAAVEEPAGLTLPMVVQALDSLVASHLALPAATEAGAAAWRDVAGQIDPAAAAGLGAGGPYAATAGTPVTLHAEAGAAPIDGFAWDLDADGAFDDATGPDPSARFDRAGSRLVGVRATSGDTTEVAYAFLTVAPSGHRPTVDAASPAAPGLTIVTGSPQAFAVTASDADGDPITYRWTLDGAAVAATGATYEYAPDGDAVGRHVVDVEAVDGAGGSSVHMTWDVAVVAPDADHDGWTATTDCEEGDAAVHPSAHERLGNGVDDDCDAGTPDAPPGGLTGTMMSWGSNHNGSVGVGDQPYPNAATPLAIAGFDDVVQVESRDRGGIAVLSNGEVVNWGTNLVGELGTGAATVNIASATPVHPLTVGGGAGHLSGVTQASGHVHVVARRADGTAVAWGNNSAGQLGDGSTVNYRPYPVEVLAGPGQGALAGVRAVEAGYAESYFLMDDGTVRVAGQVRCDGGTQVTAQPYPATLGLLGGGVRRASSGNQWALFLKEDGTVLSCGGSTATAGRPIVSLEDVFTPGVVTGFGPGSGAVDVAAGLEGGAVLSDDGTVWMWGHNANGSLSAAGVAPGATLTTPTPVPLPPGPPVVDIDMDNACHLLATRADGSLLGWGCDAFEQVGDGPGSGIVAVPTVIDMAGRAVVGAASSGWNSLVLTRPLDDGGWERPATWVNASVADATTTEGASAQFTVSLSDALPMDVSVQWEAEAGTADAGDLASRNGTTTIPAGHTAAVADVAITDDALDEPDEAFTVRLTATSHGVRLGRGAAHGAILDDDAEPALSIAPVAVPEGDTALTDLAVPVTLSAPSAGDVVVHVVTADGTATAGDDYTAADVRVVVPAGQTQAVAHIAVAGDRAAEPDEAFTLTLAQPERARIATGSAAVTITDDEALALQVTSPSVAEGDAGTRPATFTVALVPPAPAGTSVTVAYTVVGLTATVPDDVGAATGTLTFAAGDGPVQVTVDVVGDTAHEAHEVFALRLGRPDVLGPRAVLIGDNPPASIVDDDPAPGANRPPTVTAGSPVTVLEGSVVALDGTVTDPDGDPVTASWAVAPAAGTDAGASCTFAPPTSAATTIACTDDGRYAATLTATDPSGNATSATVEVTVQNAAPVVEVLSPVGGTAVGTGTALAVVAVLDDAGGNDTATCSLDWGDGTSEAGTLSGDECRGEHAYAATGARTVTVSVVDDDGDAGTASVAVEVGCTRGAKVTAGGWVVDGGTRTSFGLVARASGAAFAGEVSVKAGGHRLHSTAITALAAPDARSAVITGSATWDGVAGHAFTVTVRDLRRGNRRRGPADTFSLEVRDPAGAVVFSTAASLAGGSVTVHG